MNIGIIIWSQTGHTHAVAEKIKDKLDAAGHTAKIENLKIVGEFNPRQKDIRFEILPDLKQYDGIVFGAPVHAFSLCRPMNEYLKHIPSLDGKKIALFTTKQLRFKWTGGSQAINKMKKYCKRKGGIVTGSEIVVWSSPDRENMIQDGAARISKVL